MQQLATVLMCFTCAPCILLSFYRAGNQCTGIEAPVDGEMGTCNSKLLHGASCEYTCATGYILSNSTSCFAGVLTEGECTQAPNETLYCNTSIPPEYGDTGNCPETLEGGYSCQPNCSSGFTVSGATSCALDGSITAATCEDIAWQCRTVYKSVCVIRV